MNKAMFAGVAGLKTHQSKMDVIGNNIANVNTYGYKSQRAIFSDVYYQTIQGATEGTAYSGGTNPSSIGYGSMLAGVTTQMTTSSLQSTGYGLDVAIAGEGFLQVMDADGNIFYTKAGMLKYDSNGYLVDINGNFVLGASGSASDPDSQKIKLDDIGSVDSSKPSVDMTVNGIEYTLSASNATKYGNVSISLASSESLPAGLAATAEISATGSISVFLNAYQEFASMDEINTAINDAILEANGGVPHAAGTFTLSTTENVFGTDAVNASISGSTVANDPTATIDSSFMSGQMTITDFSPSGVTSGTAGSYSVTALAGATDEYTVAITVDGVTYSNTIKALSNSDLVLSAEDGSGGTITLGMGNQGYVTTANILNASSGTVTTTSAMNFLGGASVSGITSTSELSGSIVFNSFTESAAGIDVEFSVGQNIFSGTIPTTGGPVEFTALTGEIISMNFPTFDEMKANLNLEDTAATDVLAAALETSSGSAYHSLSLVAAKPAVSSSLTGAQIIGTAGGIDYGSVSGTTADNGFFGGIMTIEEVSSRFSGSGTVSSTDFTATYTEANEDTGAAAFWSIEMDVDGTLYTATLADGEQASSLLLQASSGDYMVLSNPGFDAMNKAFTDTGSAVVDGVSFNAFGTTDADITVTPSQTSSNLGLGTSSFVLAGGTEGGSITLDEISNISIGSNGTIAVSHAEKGTVVAGKISLAVFANSGGLQLMGTNYYAETANSGSAVLVDPGSDGSGGLTASALEMSNVDISNEFAEMITCQRGFQANSRIITVSDTMLEELINLKR